MFKKILVPIDFSDVSGDVLKMAADIAQKYDSQIFLVYVHQIMSDVSVYDTVVPIIPLDTENRCVEDASRKRLARSAEELSAQGISVEACFYEGFPGGEILNAAQEHGVDLIILGSHGHGALYHLMLGSVSEKVIDKAECPVLVVKKAKA